jgi:putative hydrolase of the HAD superfamily
VAVPGLPLVILFDLDDTILRFSAGQPDFWQLALQVHLPSRDDHATLVAALRGANEEFWGPAARAFWGRQNMHEARRRIACAALAELGLSREACHQIADEMTEQKEAQVRPFEGALETLRWLREQGHRLGLLTNGSALFQRRKLARFALEPLFELVLVEGELGYGKPDRRVFSAALEHFGISPTETWMIGDNLEADVAGAQGVGITGVWHDAHARGLPDGSAVTPDRVITSLASLRGDV